MPPIPLAAPWRVVVFVQIMVEGEKPLVTTARETRRKSFIVNFKLAIEAQQQNEVRRVLTKFETVSNNFTVKS